MTATKPRRAARKRKATTAGKSVPGTKLSNGDGPLRMIRFQSPKIIKPFGMILPDAETARRREAKKKGLEEPEPMNHFLSRLVAESLRAKGFVVSAGRPLDSLDRAMGRMFAVPPPFAHVAAMMIRDALKARGVKTTKGEAA